VTARTSALTAPPTAAVLQANRSRASASLGRFRPGMWRRSSHSHATRLTSRSRLSTAAPPAAGAQLRRNSHKRGRKSARSACALGRSALQQPAAHANRTRASSNRLHDGSKHNGNKLESPTAISVQRPPARVPALAHHRGGGVRSRFYQPASTTVATPRARRVDGARGHSFFAGPVTRRFRSGPSGRAS